MHLLLAASALAIDLGAAEPLPEADRATIRELRPKHLLLPSNPRGQTDFTAYTLEWGEVRVGIGSVGVGVLPRVQVSTSPVLDVLGAANVSGKIDAVRAGPLDLAVSGTWCGYDGETLDARVLGAGASASLIVAKPWSIHSGVDWTDAEVAGTPQLDTFASVLGAQTGTDLTAAQVTAAEEALELRAHVTAVRARVATDVRVNRRDSLVLQGQAVTWADVDTPDAVQGLVSDRTGPVAVEEAYAASLAWQISWHNVDLRVGAGVSSVPGAWLFNTFDLAWRFGGPTRAEERRMNAGWRENRREVAKAARKGTEPELL
ncbi:MAG: hypothetical protein ACOZNI_21305 [Myxococcota bacterium]